MDQIKKKMLSMKMEKENALDRAEQLEQKLRDTEEQKAKVEEDLTVLQKKHQHLENDFDKVNEQLQEAVVKLETSEKRVTEDSFGELDMSEEHEMETQLDVDGELRKSNDSLRVSQECLQCSELSQESQCSVLSISLDTGNTDETATKKKKVKKTKKKKIKTKKKDVENSDNAEKKEKKSSAKKTKVKKSGDKTKTDRNSSSSSTSKHRPEPEGGNSVNLNHMDEYDRVIYGNEPLFSDLELSGGEGDSVYYLPPPRQQSGRNRPGGIFVPGMLGVNSSTMIKFAIIETELKNILRVSLKRVGAIDLECKVLP